MTFLSGRWCKLQSFPDAPLGILVALNSQIFWTDVYSASCMDDPELVILLLVIKLVILYSTIGLQYHLSYAPYRLALVCVRFRFHLRSVFSFSYSYCLLF